MQLKPFAFLTLLFLAGATLFGSPRLASAYSRAVPSNVGLVFFGAETDPNGVLLTWETATELNTAGFEIHRRDGLSGSFNYLEEIGFIDSEGGPALGYIYTALDETAVLGQLYTYRLIEIEFSGDTIELEDVIIIVGATPTPTPSQTPTVTPTPTNTTQPAQIASSTPTNTAPAATPTHTATATPTPTSTTNPTRASSTTTTPTPANTASPRPGQSADTRSTATPTTNNAPTRAATSAATTGNNANTPVPTPTNNDDNQSDTRSLTQATTNAPATTNEGVVLAQANDTATPATSPAQEESYPGQTDDTNAQTATIANPTPSPLAVIGGNQAYAGPDNAAPGNTAVATDSPNRATLFLWLGFIVALLIFITGVVGSIILYTRKSR